MPLISDASLVALGDQPVDAVYARDAKVWPTGAVLPSFLWTFNEAAEWTADHAGGPTMPTWAPGGWTLPQDTGGAPQGHIRSPAIGADIVGTGPYVIRVEATLTAWDENIIRPILITAHTLSGADPLETTFLGGIGEHKTITMIVPIVTAAFGAVTVEASHHISSNFTFYIDEVEVAPA